MSRKTVPIIELIEKVNLKNKISTCDPNVRKGQNNLLEMILHGNGVYAGFGYLDSNNVPKGTLPGVEKDSEGNCISFPDDTRRFYYVHDKLR